MRTPPPHLKTRRLVIRTLSAKDIPAYLDYLAAERRDHARWTPRRPGEDTAAHWRKALRLRERDRREGRSLFLFLFVKGRPREIVGHASLSNIVRGAFQACHLGYALRKGHEGQGLMTQALRAILRHAFGPMGLHRVMANYMPSNRRSARVLEGLGFRREGLAKEYLRIAGRWEDHVLTSLVNPRWKPGTTGGPPSPGGPRPRGSRPSRGTPATRSPSSAR
jgi:ribosomal-protein-alanine N-acetyltransferase